MVGFHPAEFRRKEAFLPPHPDVWKVGPFFARDLEMVRMEMVPLQIVSRDMRLSPSIRFAIRERFSHLQQLFDGLVRCEVTIDRPHRHHRKGGKYHITIRMSVPGNTLAVSREAEEDGAHEIFPIALHDAFRAAERRLLHYSKKMQDHGPISNHFQRGWISRIYPDLDYGFIQCTDGREIYFHRNSVKGGHFENLNEGMVVRFQDEPGDKGPQASFVRSVY